MEFSFSSWVDVQNDAGRIRMRAGGFIHLRLYPEPAIKAIAALGFLYDGILAPKQVFTGPVPINPLFVGVIAI